MTQTQVLPERAIGVPTLAERLRAVPSSDWVKCPACSYGIYHQRLADHHRVCPDCGHHFRLSAAQRVELLVDPGSWVEQDAGMHARDPLGFVDSVPYQQRLTDARRRTGRADAAGYGFATIGGHDVVLCVLDFAFQGGSMGAVVGEKVARAAESALAARVPLITCATSGGARMQEGIFSLLQMAKTAAALDRLRQAGVPFASILADPVYGGVTASFASLGDVIVAEPGARAGFAGPQVIEQTIRQRLPEGFQTAEFLLENGHIDAVVPRGELRSWLARWVHFHALAALAGPFEAATPAPAGTTAAPAGMSAPAGAGSGSGGRDAWEIVKAARDPHRPHLGEYLELVLDDFAELHGDRSHADDAAIVGGLGLLGGRPVVVVGHRKDRGTKEAIARNFGMPHPAGYRKAERLMRYADRFGLPLITFVDTPGAYPGLRAEQENQSGAIASAIATMSALRVPVVTVVVGEGGSGGALAVGVADRLLMLSHATYSVISPEGCATILFGDAGRAPQAAAALCLTAAELARFGVADEVIPEPDGGAGADHALTARRVRAALLRHLTELSRVDPATLRDGRYRRLRAFGPYSEKRTSREEPDANVR